MNHFTKMHLQLFAMKSLDLLQKEKAAILQRINAAVKDGNETDFAAAFTEFTDLLQEAVLNEARGLIQASDNAVLAGRGARALTSEENKYYESLITAMRSTNPQQAMNDLSDVLPKTVIDQIFVDLVDSHPILEVLNFQNTGALVEMPMNDGYSPLATWGELTATIITEITSGFSVVKLTQAKLSAFIPVGKSLLDLGPVWLDRYVRATLADALAGGLEAGGVDGNGKDAPIGMTRALSGAVDGVYPRKTAVAVTKLDAATYGSILDTLSTVTKTLTVGEDTVTVTRRRAVSEIILVVNPADYFTKIFPATTVRNVNGGYNNDVFPFPTKVFQSAACPANRAIFGLPSRYFYGLGTARGGKLEYSDEYKFLEDQRTYLIKLYGMGRPMDANAFVLADITSLTAEVPQVYLAGGEVELAAQPIEVQGVGDARLASLKIGAKTLVPGFNKSVHVYSCATTDATNTVTAVAMNGEAAIEILLGETPVVNGAAATWATGANTLTVTVTLGDATETYTVTVTKS